MMTTQIFGKENVCKPILKENNDGKMNKLITKKAIKSKVKSLKLVRPSESVLLNANNLINTKSNTKGYSTEQQPKSYMDLEQIICNLEIDINNCNSSISTAEPSSKSKNDEFKFKFPVQAFSNLNSNLNLDVQKSKSSTDKYPSLCQKNNFVSQANPEMCEYRNNSSGSTRLAFLKQKKNLSLNIENINANSEYSTYNQINDIESNHIITIEDLNCNDLSMSRPGHKPKASYNFHQQEAKSVTISNINDLDSLYNSEAHTSINYPGQAQYLINQNDIEETEENPARQNQSYFMNIKGAQLCEESLEIIKEQDTPFTQTPNTYKTANSRSKAKLYLEGRLGGMLGNYTGTKKDDTVTKKLKSMTSFLENMTNANSPQVPFEYLGDIFYSLRFEENEFVFTPKKTHTKARAILVDWLMDVADKFKLMDETYFLAVSILDKYLSVEKNKSVSLDKYQLFGTASLSIACKYEEIYSPEVRDFVYITDSTYTKEEILACELDILITLQFKITYPSPLRFLEILFFFCGFDKGPRNSDQYSKQYKEEKQNLLDAFIKYKHLSEYLLHLFSLHYKYNFYRPSWIAFAIASVCLRVRDGISIYDKQPQIIYLPQLLLDLLNHDEIKEVSKCYVDILFNLEYHHTTGLLTVIEKYKKDTFSRVASIKIV